MEKLLVFHLDDNNLKKLKQITGALKVRVEEVLSSDYLKPLEMIANKTASPLIQPFSGKVPAESLIVFCDFTEKKMDKLLASLRRDQVVIDYKSSAYADKSEMECDADVFGDAGGKGCLSEK